MKRFSLKHPKSIYYGMLAFVLFSLTPPKLLAQTSPNFYGMVTNMAQKPVVGHKVWIMADTAGQQFGLGGTVTDTNGIYQLPVTVWGKGVKYTINTYDCNFKIISRALNPDITLRPGSRMDANFIICDSPTVAPPYPPLPPPAPAPVCKASFKVMYGDNASLNPLSCQFINTTVCSDASKPMKYVWNFGDGIMDAAYSPKHQYSKAGDYVVRLEIWDDRGIISAHKELIRFAKPIDSTIINICDFKPYFDFATSDRTIKVVNNSPFQGMVYWTFGDGDSAMAPVAQHTYAQNGDYEVCMTLTTAIGCAQTLCRRITVGGYVPTPYPQPEPQPAKLYGKIIASTLAKGKYAVEIMGYNTGYYASKEFDMADSTGFEFSDLPEGRYMVRAKIMAATANENGYLPTYAGNTPYWEKAEVMYIKGETWTKIVMAEAAPIQREGNCLIKGYIGGKGDTLRNNRPGYDSLQPVFCAKQAVALLYDKDGRLLRAIPVGPDSSYSFTNLPEGEYKVRIEYPKMSTDAQPVVLRSKDDFAVLIYEPNNDSLIIVNSKGIRCYTPYLSQELKAYPNPVINTATVSLDANKTIADIMLISRMGQVSNVKFNIINPNTADLSLISLPSGTYTVRVITTDGEVLHKILVKL